MNGSKTSLKKIYGKSNKYLINNITDYKPYLMDENICLYKSKKYDLESKTYQHGAKGNIRINSTKPKKIIIKQHSKNKSCFGSKTAMPFFKNRYLSKKSSSKKSSSKKSSSKNSRKVSKNKIVFPQKLWIINIYQRCKLK